MFPNRIKRLRLCYGLGPLGAAATGQADRDTATGNRAVETADVREKDSRAMDVAQNVAILLVAATSFWAFIALKKRIEFLEHEVRWLRSELNDIKLVDSDGQDQA